MQQHTAGLDLASEEHRLAVVDGGGRRIEERRVVHSEDGVEALVRRLGEWRGASPRGRTCRPEVLLWRSLA
jgi:hypothetical protein